MNDCRFNILSTSEDLQSNPLCWPHRNLLLIIFFVFFFFEEETVSGTKILSLEPRVNENIARNKRDPHLLWGCCRCCTNSSVMIPKERDVTARSRESYHSTVNKQATAALQRGAEESVRLHRNEVWDPVWLHVWPTLCCVGVCQTARDPLDSASSGLLCAHSVGPLYSESKLTF